MWKRHPTPSPAVGFLAVAFLCLRIEVPLLDKFFKLTGRSRTHERPVLKYTVHPLSLTQEDIHCMRMDASHVPKPVIQPSYAIEFKLSVGQNIMSDVHSLKRIKS